MSWVMNGKRIFMQNGELLEVEVVEAFLSSVFRMMSEDGGGGRSKIL